MITVLAGGVGAARLLAGLVHVAPPSDLTAVVNTGDDTEMHGLAICPDLDTVTYTLAGAIDAERGWGLAGETWAAMSALARYESARPPASTAGATWFGLGDRDLATHLYRTHRLAEGATLSQVTAEVTAAWDIGVRLLPMTDDGVRTMLTLESDGGEIGFQDYFVRRRHDVAITSVRFAGIDSAHPAPGVLDALEGADVVVIAPSNPIVSIGPILAVRGVREVLATRRRSVVSVSPIVGGRALRGPADRMLRELGIDPTAVGVADQYREVAATIVIDREDEALTPDIEALGLRVLVTDTVMRSPDVAAALAKTTIEAAAP
jgi:LPPG:FO 2-phospho-L-lactate transferase